MAAARRVAALEAVAEDARPHEPQRRIAGVAGENLLPVRIAEPADDELGEHAPEVGGDVEVGGVVELVVGESGPGAVEAADVSSCGPDVIRTR